MTRTAYRTCPLCEATCGLELNVDGDELVRVRGDADDVLSHGFLCPKGVALKELHADPDRLRAPLVRGEDGELRAAGWEEAFARIETGLAPILAGGDRQALAAYVGNPNAHNLANILYLPVFLKALGSRNVFSASTLDQYPKQMAAALMFGTGFSVAVPDVDRCDHLLVLGANPLASNGSLWTVPDARGRLRAMRRRGGKLVVVDPRRSRTAQEADEWVPVRPGTDALLLFGIVHSLFAEGLVRTGGLDEWLEGADAVEELAADFSPGRVAEACGVDAERIVRMARELAESPRAAVYGRIGTCTQEFGTLASWLVDVVNVLAGNLDVPGGAMFPKAAAGHRNAAGPPGVGRGARFGRWGSRVRGLGEVFGELPTACLAEEIDTSGEGQVRALFCVGGNPARSAPNSARLEAALAGLELVVCVDVYVNETSRHADVILPAPSPLRRPHYDLALYQFATRNVARYSAPVLEPQPELPDEWVTLLRLAAIVSGQGVDADVEALDGFVAAGVAARELGESAETALAAVGARRGPERLLDLLLRAGPYDLTLADLEAAPHGIDLGALEPRVPELLRTASGRIELAPELLVADVPRLRAALERPLDGGLTLVGRRDLRSNNSWMHNLPLLVSGPARCTLHVHPEDAARLGVVDGEAAVVRSRTGQLQAPVEVTEDVMRGVVSLPHGWGHDGDGLGLGVAAAHAGTNSNVLADDAVVDVPSGNAVLNGIPVEVAPVAALAPA